MKKKPSPLLYDNWLAHQENVNLDALREYPVFSDGNISGGIIDQYGPYEVINTLHDQHMISRPSLILRIGHFLKWNYSETETDTSNYHGGYLQDELTALISLCLGIRAKAGSYSRDFGRFPNTPGIPVSWSLDVDPVLPNLPEILRLPSAVEPTSLDKANIISTFLTIPSEAAMALIRAARLYQEALWIIEITPELSWIMLTSAIEVVAGYWRAKDKDYVDRLKNSTLQGVVDLLRAEGNSEECINKAAKLMAPYVGNTKRFVDFIIEFLPPPPEVRPEGVFKLQWTEEAFRPALKMIYGFRSQALHAGLPFPAPLLKPGFPRQDKIYPEKPFGGVIGMKGSTWSSGDLPMFIHIFEHIVRGSILNWWSSLACTV